MKILTQLILALGFTSVALFADERPNIVLILADDVSPDSFGCYGQPDATETPNIDRLADEGVAFNTCYTAAICGPSRALIMTGKYPESTGVYHNGIWLGAARRDLFTKQHSWAKLLSDSGYATAVAGKWHCGALMPWEEPVGFDEYCLWEGPGKVKEHTGVDVYAEGLRDKSKDLSDYRYWYPSMVINGKYVPAEPTDFGPDISCEFLMDFMERKTKESQPFVAYWPTVAPHGPYSTTPDFGEPGNLFVPKPNFSGMSREEKAAALAKYEVENKERFDHLVQYMDKLVGRLMDKADSLGIADNTYFIFCSDNGTASIAKNRGVERGVHVAYVVRGPGIKAQGITDALTDFSDVAPTLMEIAGVAWPSEDAFDGISQLPFLTGERDEQREWIYGYTGTAQVFRTKNYLLEARDHVLDNPDGRFYYTGASRFGRGYERIDNNPEHAKARAEFEQIMAQFPPLKKDNPYWEDKKGKGWLKEYSGSTSKFHHNHERYRFYDED